MNWGNYDECISPLSKTTVTYSWNLFCVNVLDYQVSHPKTEMFITTPWSNSEHKRGSQKCINYTKETVQGVIEEALNSTLCFANNPLTHFASRTDKGVHALINTFHVDLEHKRQGEVYQPHVVKKALNSFLNTHEHEILVSNASVVPDNFHARFDVKWRRYVYRLAVLNPESRVTYPDVKSCEEYLPISLLHRCHIVQSNLKIDDVKNAVNLYRGSHDFCAFTKNTLREPWRITKRIIDEIDFYELPSFNYSIDSRCSSFSMWEFCVKSSSFLYHQVRKLVGTALAAGFGKMTLSDIESLLKYPTPDKFSKSQLAPACGLYLANIHYDKDSFNRGKELNVHKGSLPVS